MPDNLDLKKFNELLKLPDSLEKENQLKFLIDSYLCHHFESENRLWFNNLCNEGLINLIYHCERTIPYFTLYNNKEKPDHISNISFLWAIESGNLELIEYFTQHEDFPKFCKRKDLKKDISRFINLYRQRSSNFTFKNYSAIVDFLIEKFPWSIPPTFESNVLTNKNEELTEFLISFVQKYKPYLHEYILENDNYTRFCMVSLNHNCLKFCDFFYKQYPQFKHDKDSIEFFLFYSHNLGTLDWMIDNPNFFDLKKLNFNKMYRYIFQNDLNKVFYSSDYDFFSLAVKYKLHTVNHNEMQLSINKNITPFVKKYYRFFKDSSFDLSLDNTCTRFIERQEKEKLYKSLLEKFPASGLKQKKAKI